MKTHPKREAPFANPKLIVLAFAIALAGRAQPQALPPNVSAQSSNAADQDSLPLYMKVSVDKSIQMRKLKPGATVEGELLDPVYSENRQLFAQGTSVSMTVGGTERRRRVPNDHWPWVVKAFTPRHENFPLFSSARVALHEGGEVPLQVNVVSIAPEVRVRAKTRRSAAVQTVTLRGALASDGGEVEAQHATPASTDGAVSAGTVPAGTQTRVILLSSVSASGNHVGDPIEARLIEPVRIDDRVVLPQGSILEGRVAKVVPPRWASRAGSLLIEFTYLSVPALPRATVETSITEAVLAERSHTSLDTEGNLRGAHPGKAWMLIDLGVTAGIAKESDDTTQLIIEAIVSTATDASTAGTARIVGACASAIFVITRHGRDVVLPKYTQMRVMFDKAVLLPSEPAGSSPAAEPHEPHDPAD